MHEEDDFMIGHAPQPSTEGPTALGRYLADSEFTPYVPNAGAASHAEPQASDSRPGDSRPGDSRLSDSRPSESGSAGANDRQSRAAMEHKAEARAAKFNEKLAEHREKLSEYKPAVAGSKHSTNHTPAFPVIHSAGLSPMDTLHRRFPTVMRGYRKEDVHLFLSEISQQLEAHLQERNELYQKIHELEEQVEHYRNAEDELRRTVVAAERISHELREQTKREASNMLQEAEQRAMLLAEQATTREREALASHDARMTELEATFSARRAALERHYQQQEHALETRARERSGQLEREFSSRYAEVSGRLTSAHAEYANFMAQYRAVSQAFAQAANTQLLPENPALLSPDSALATRLPMTSLQVDLTPLRPAPVESSKRSSDRVDVLIEDQHF